MFGTEGTYDSFNRNVKYLVQNTWHDVLNTYLCDDITDTGFTYEGCRKDREEDKTYAGRDYI